MEIGMIGLGRMVVHHLEPIFSALMPGGDAAPRTRGRSGGLTAGAPLNDPQLAAYGARVSHSGEGRWTIEAAVDEVVPTHVLSAAGRT